MEPQGKEDTFTARASICEIELREVPLPIKGGLPRYSEEDS